MKKAAWIIALTLVLMPKVLVYAADFSDDIGIPEQSYEETVTDEGTGEAENPPAAETPAEGTVQTETEAAAPMTEQTEEQVQADNKTEETGQAAAKAEPKQETEKIKGAAAEEDQAAKAQDSAGSGYGTSSYYGGGTYSGGAGEDDSALLRRIYNAVVYERMRMYGDSYIPQEFGRYIFIGDSRTAGMQMSVPANSQDCWSCRDSTGYDWMVSSGIPAVEPAITENTAVFILFGVNDLGNVNNYISYINRKTLEWEALGAETFFVAVGPVGNTTVTNAQIENFNRAVWENTCATYIDLYSALLYNGFSTQDGLHYTSGTYTYIYNYLKEQAVLLKNLG